LSASAPATAKQSSIDTSISAPGRAPFSVSRVQQKTILCLVLVAVTLGFYNRVGKNGFTNFDDTSYVTENSHVRAGLTWETVKWSFTSREYSNWHPVTWLSHALDYQLFGLNPVGHHYVSLLLHACNAVLLFWLLEAATGLTWPSLMVAALFALHPVNVESVAWAAERKNVLSMFFFLLTLRTYEWYARRVGIGRYMAVAALFALGLMAKPEIVTLPFVLLLWDYWPLGRMWGASGVGVAEYAANPHVSQRKRDMGHPSETFGRRSFGFLVLEKVPLLVLSAASCVITISAQRGGQAVRAASAWVRWGNAPVAYLRYLGKAFWPVQLAAFYPHAGGGLAVWRVAASGAVLLVVTIAVLRVKNRRYLPVGWFWFLGTLVPVLGLMQVGLQSIADRYAYLPYIGLFVAVVWGVAELTEERSVSGVWLGVLGSVVVVSLGLVTRGQVGYWRDSETLWRHTLAATGDRNFAAHDGLARDLALHGRADEAIAEFRKAESVYDYTPLAMMDIAAYERANGHLTDAIFDYRRAAELSGDSRSRAEALSRLGSAFIQAGDFAGAKSAYSAVLLENGDDARGLMACGLLAERDGDFGLAVGKISRAVKIEASDVGYLLLGQALRRAGRLAEADAAEERAREISRDLVAARAVVAQVSASFGVGNYSGMK
jgi:protein O-mannosyl-transferase